MPTKRVKGKKKLKSIKAKQTDQHGSKRRLAKLGKEQKKGMKGTVANYITRSQAIKKLQITLKDFRRLCILKGIYPRDPKKKASGKATTYYYIKDVMHLAHEPILEKFREMKTFMKKLKKAIGRKDISEARRKNEGKPTYALDHIVKERYPRFIDALGDLDDALCLIHLFAVMPAIKGLKADVTESCLRLCREWQNYIAVSRSLTKVFISIKGIYYQAEVCGQTITWLVPHTFTPTFDKHVDIRVMMTFLEFYEVLLKFINFKLYTDMGVAYPPRIDLQLDGAGVQLAAMKMEKLNAPITEKSYSKKNTQRAETEDAHPGTEAAKKQQEESEGRISSLLPAIQDEEENVHGDEQDKEYAQKEGQGERMNYDDGMRSRLTTELEAAFASDVLAVQFVHDSNKENIQDKLMFHGLTFFLSREVPHACLECILRSQGGTVAWDGPGSPLAEKSDLITHHVMDRPSQGHVYFNREYVQPQWIFDSLNNGMLLPVTPYAPGASLPPHLSPFVNDADVGYVPEYRKELNALKSALDVHKARVKHRAAHDDDDDADADGTSEEEDEVAEVDEEAAYVQGLLVETKDREKIMDGKDNQHEDENDDDDDIDKDSEDEDDEASNAGVGEKRRRSMHAGDMEILPLKPSKKLKQKEEAEELHEMAISMMNKKAKRLYHRMQHGIGKKSDAVKALEDKKKALLKLKTT